METVSLLPVAATELMTLREAVPRAALALNGLQ